MALREKKLLIGGAFSMVLVGLILLVLLAVGTHSVSPGAHGGLWGFIDRLFPIPPDELDSLEEELEIWFSTRSGQPCRRPVLRGDAREGDGGLAWAKLITEPPPNVAICLAHIGESGVLADTELGRIEFETNNEVDIYELCLPLVKEMVGPTKFADACARPLPDMTYSRPLFDFFNAATAWLVAASRKDERTDLLNIGSDLLRLAQDTARGPYGGVVRAMLSATVLYTVSEFGLRNILNGTEGFGSEELSRFVGELEVLMESEPSFGEVRAAEIRLSTAETWLPCARGGVEFLPDVLREVPRRGLGWLREDDATGGSFPTASCGWWASATELWVESAMRACPHGVAGSACLEGLRREWEQADRKAWIPTALFSALGSGQPLNSFRKTMLAASPFFPPTK